MPIDGACIVAPNFTDVFFDSDATSDAAAEVLDRVSGLGVEVQAELDELLSVTGIPGAQLGVYDGYETRVFCSGVRDLGSGAPVTPDTRFTFASVTKLFSIVAALRLQEAGRLDISARVRDLLVGIDLPYAVRDVTIGQLLGHVGGIDGTISLPEESTDLVSAVLEQAHTILPVANPGRLFSLSNAGFLIAAAAISKHVGTDWTTLLRDEVLEVIDAPHAVLSADKAQATSMAKGHVPNRRGQLLEMPAYVGSPAIAASGGLFGTVEDLLLLGRALLPQRGGAEPQPRSGLNHVLSSASLAEMHRPLVEAPDAHWKSVGLGWFHAGWTRLVMDARGSDVGQEALLRIVPESGRCMALLTNGWTRQWPYFDVLPTTTRRLLGTAMKRDPAVRPPTESEVRRVVGDYSRDGVLLVVRATEAGEPVLSALNQGDRTGLFVELHDIPLESIGRDMFLFRVPEVHDLRLRPIDRPLTLAFTGRLADGSAEHAHFMMRVARRVGDSGTDARPVESSVA